MDTIKFARLVNWLSKRGIDELATHELQDLFNMVRSENNCEDVNALLEAMQSGKKIDAIKAYRTLRHTGLLESKNAVEKYWSFKSDDVT